MKSISPFRTKYLEHCFASKKNYVPRSLKEEIYYFLNLMIKFLIDVYLFAAGDTVSFLVPDGEGKEPLGFFGNTVPLLTVVLKGRVCTSGLAVKQAEDEITVLIFFFFPPANNIRIFKNICVVGHFCFTIAKFTIDEGFNKEEFFKLLFL